MSKRRMSILTALLASAFVAVVVGGAAPRTAVAQEKAAAKAAPSAATPAQPADDAHRREDIAKHRQMSRAHEDAARCLESGEKENVCAERLRAACSGIAVGRYCGMRHAH